MVEQSPAHVAEEYLQSVIDIQKRMGYTATVAPAAYDKALEEATRVFEGFSVLSQTPLEKR